MRKCLFFIAVFWLIVSGCGSSENELCYHGKVILYSCCTGTTFISLDSVFLIGKDTELYGKHYSNVIQAPGDLPTGDIYLNLRAYNPEKDQSLYPPLICYCLIVVGMNVPVWVQTGYSYESCLISESK